KFAIGFGKEEHALLVDCDTYKIDYIPLSFDNHCLLIVDTNKPKKLSDSLFNERRNECERALIELQAYTPVNHLVELTRETFASTNHYLKDSTLQKRVKHIVSENERTKQAADFLRSNDMESLGKIFTASQNSLQQNYDISGYETNQLAIIAENQT